MNRILKARMVEHYGNQFGFAQAAGVHESDVSLVVRGKRPLSVAKQEAWAKLLNSKREELFEND